MYLGKVIRKGDDIDRECDPGKAVQVLVKRQRQRTKNVTKM